MKASLQGLVDKVTGGLSSPTDRPANLAPYSVLSRARRQVFDTTPLYSLEESGSAGISQYTCYTTFQKIETLEEVKAHIRAFTCIGGLNIEKCNFLSLPSVVKCFTPISSTLTELAIIESPTASHTFVSILAALPQLKSLSVEDSKITSDRDGTSPLPNIPFFEGSGCFKLRYSDLDQHNLDWIPSSARFEELDITTSFLHIPTLVNKWLYNSRATLRTFAILGDSDPRPISHPPLLDLLPCQALATLEVSVGLCRPGLTAETVLSSIISSKLSVVCLVWDIVGEVEDEPKINYLAWEVVENRLLRLAERFSAGNPGKKMRVDIYCSDDPGDERSELRESHFLAQIKSKEFLSKLREEANFSLGKPGWR